MVPIHTHILQPEVHESPSYPNILANANLVFSNLIFFQSDEYKNGVSILFNLLFLMLVKLNIIHLGFLLCKLPIYIYCSFFPLACALLLALYNSDFYILDNTSVENIHAWHPCSVKAKAKTEYHYYRINSWNIIEILSVRVFTVTILLINF